MNVHEGDWTLVTDHPQDGVASDVVGLVVRTCGDGDLATLLMSVGMAVQVDVARVTCPACGQAARLPGFPWVDEVTVVDAPEGTVRLAVEVPGQSAN